MAEEIQQQHYSFAVSNLSQNLKKIGFLIKQKLEAKFYLHLSYHRLARTGQQDNLL